MEEELRSGIETLKDISEGAVPPEISIEETKAILKRYKELEEDNKELVKNNYRLTNELENKRKEYQETYKDVREELKELKNDIKLQKIFNKKLIETSIPISVIQKYKEKFLEDSKNEKVFMTQSTQINASLISFCDELLEERNK